MGKDINGKDLPTGITFRKDGRYMWRFKYAGITYSGYSRKLQDAKKAMRDKWYEVEHGIYSKEQEKKRALTENVERKFLEAARISCYYPLYRLASLTGMRIGEVLGLRWQDVDFDKGEIHITHTMCYTPGQGQYLDSPKSAASRRIIPMEKNSEIYTLLRDWRKKQRYQRLQAGKYWLPLEGMEDIVFTSNHGTPHYDMNVRTDQRKIVAQLKASGVEIDCCNFTLCDTVLLQDV